MTIDYNFSSTKDLVILCNNTYDLNQSHGIECMIYSFEESINLVDTVCLNFCKINLTMFGNSHYNIKSFFTTEEIAKYSSNIYTVDETFLIINKECHPKTRDFIHTFLEAQAEHNEYLDQFVAEASVHEKKKNGY